MVSITIDCEEWNSPHLRGIGDKDNFNTSFSREGNEALLALFRKYNIKATFFITGFYAEQEKESIKRIREEGHEIACHGYEHHYRNRIFNMEADIKKAKRVLERIAGGKVVGFRAPQMQYSTKLLYTLEKLGFKYDSSLHPAFLPGFYNNVAYPIRMHKPIPELRITEIPAAVMPRSRMPVAWMFMRNFGRKYAQLAVNRLEKKGINANLYFHSWEFVKIDSKNVPFYFTRNTGNKFLNMLEELIRVNLKKGNKFVRLSETV